MSKHVYISCDFNERQLQEVKSLCNFLEASNCIVHSAPSRGWTYDVLEELIEHCDIFIAIVGEARSCSSWLAHELNYANSLKQLRFSPRPQLFGLRIDNYVLPRCSDQIELEWLDGTNNGSLSVDLTEHV